MVVIHETDDIERLMRDHYARFRLTALHRGGSVRIARTEMGPVAIERAALSMRFTGRGAPLGFVPIGRVVSGGVAYRNDGAGGRYAPGDVFLACQPDREFEAEVDDLTFEGVHLDPRLLARTAGRAVRFTGYRPVSAAATALWNSTYDYVRESSRSVSPGPGTLLAGSLTALIAAAALSVFPHDGLVEPTIADRRDAHPASLRRAVAFIEGNAHRDLSPAEISGAAHVTVRALQLAFRRHLDTTPMAYLRRARLDHAHHDLRAADPARDSVGAIAARWGFVNHSRFTASYRAAYGVTPSQTLRS
jgi:AraC-like DNA-binding protein